MGINRYLDAEDVIDVQARTFFRRPPDDLMMHLI